LYRQEGLQFTPEDMQAEIDRAAEAQGMEADEVRQRLWEEGVLPMLRQELMHQKALAWVVEHVEVVDEERKPLVSDAEAGKKGTSKPKAAAAKAPAPKAEKPPKKAAPKESE
jgi:FKBP-type peptidyl-prolyl cis-trans isomerase (trigger factor)